MDAECKAKSYWYGVDPAIYYRDTDRVNYDRITEAFKKAQATALKQELNSIYGLTVRKGDNMKREFIILHNKDNKHPIMVFVDKIYAIEDGYVYIGGTDMYLRVKETLAEISKLLKEKYVI